jgi:hypothetical protein
LGGGSWFKANLDRKSPQDFISTNKKLNVVARTCHPSYMGSVNRRLAVQTGHCINIRNYPKNN